MRAHISTLHAGINLWYSLIMCGDKTNARDKSTPRGWHLCKSEINQYITFKHLG